MIVTEDHLKLLTRMDFDWDDECEFGGVASDFKRPFGNSDVLGDVREILGRDVSADEAKRLVIELTAVVNLAIREYHECDWSFLEGVEYPLPWRAARCLK